MKETTHTPGPVVRRLLRYLTYLGELKKQNREWVSSQKIAQYFRLTSSTVRQDLVNLNFHGVPKRGYSVKDLHQVLCNEFGIATEYKIVVVGANNLGCALAACPGFRQERFIVCGVFDTDPQAIGTPVNDLIVKDLRELNSVVRSEHVEIGVVAVSSEAAQYISDQLVLSGIKGIFNMSTAHIVAPQRISIVQIKLEDSIRELIYTIKPKLRS